MALLLLSACSSTKVNTAQSRFYQAFITRFNVYHNGNEAYKEGVSAQEQAHKDNYMEIIPLFPVSRESTRSAGGGNFDKAIEKSQKAIKLHSIKQKPKKKAGHTLTEEDKQWYAKKEYNPFLHNAWMLMGKAQFQKGEFLEAARLDGANEFFIFHRIVMPMSKNGVFAIAIFQFLWAWEDYLWPYLVITKPEKQLIAVGLKLFNGQYQTDYGSLFAATVISIIPVIIVYLLLQKRFVEGIASSGLKG